MKILLAIMVCESDKGIADALLRQLGKGFRDSNFGVVMLDDVSESQAGRYLRSKHENDFSEGFHLIENERPKGYYRLIENFFRILKYIIDEDLEFDFILRMDPDVAISDSFFFQILNSHSLPKSGVISPVFKARSRDRIQFFLDLLPFGMQRKKVDGIITHDITCNRYSNVWFAKAGLQALMHGYAGQVTPGAFILISRETLKEVARKNYLESDFSKTGLIFADDIFVGILCFAVGHRLYSCEEIDGRFKHAISLKEEDSYEFIKKEKYVFIHPLKDNAKANKIREELEKDF